MAKSIIPKELDALIQQYLTDGVLTGKERQVILKKAEGMGLDRDEVDLYLDAEVQKIEQQTDAAIRKRKGKTCPYCGNPIPQLADKCPECGEIITPEASDELKEIFDNIEDALLQLKSGIDPAKNKAIVERYTRKAKTYYGNNPKIKKLLDEVSSETIIAKKEAQEKERWEKRAAHRKTLVNTITSLITSLKFWCIISLIAGILCWIIAVITRRSSGHISDTFVYLSTDFIAGSIFGFYMVFQKNRL